MSFWPELSCTALDFRFLFAIMLGVTIKGRTASDSIAFRLSRAATVRPQGDLMEACLEMAIPQQQCVKSGPALLATSADRVPADVSGLLDRLIGVPKAALMTVFGKSTGEQIWRQCRRKRDQVREAGDIRKSEGSGVVGGSAGDDIVISGMISYVSGRAVQTLRERHREAKAIGLTISYRDGSAAQERIRLNRPSNDGEELCAAATQLFHQCHIAGKTVESVELSVSSVEAAAIPEYKHALGAAIPQGAVAHS